MMEAAARGRGRNPLSLIYDEAGAEALVRDTARRVKPDFVVLPIWFDHCAPGLVAHEYQVAVDAYDVLTDQP